MVERRDLRASMSGPRAAGWLAAALILAPGCGPDAPAPAPNSAPNSPQNPAQSSAQSSAEHSAANSPSTSNPTPAAPAAAATDAFLAQDSRISYLLAPCTKSEHYDVDTADVAGMLTEMLLRGDRDALRRAREELAARGPEGLAVARRVVDTYMNDKDGYAHLRNAIEVCERSSAPGAREVLLQVLDCPFEGVAVQAVQALGKHGVPADLEAVLEVFERASPENKIKVATAMHAIDAERASLIYLDWIDAGEATTNWDVYCQAISSSTSSQVARRANELRPLVAPRFRAQLAAPAARAGDEDALEFLRGELAAEEPWRRELAIAAFSAAGRPEELAQLALEEPHSEVRLRAINALTPTSPAQIEALRTGSLSADEGLASACLNILIRQGDALAIDRALEMLGAGPYEFLGLAMGALEPVLSKDRGVAARALEVLSRRVAAEAATPLAERVSILESIARIPLDDAARLLRERARGEHAPIKGMPAQRWFLRLVGNLGEPGQRLAAEELATAKDPALRFDLLEALCTRSTPYARGELMRLIEAGELSPYELVFAAERLTLMASVEDAAPLLKRATLRVEQADARRALQCMLWRSFPGRR
jgi:hypothetical protein